jgi:dihydropteroate synthase
MINRKVNFGGQTLEFGKKTLIMGILNITPDSFSDGGQYHSIQAAIQRAKQMIDEGADIIDIGGESTRPGAAPVSLDEELSRVIPVIEALRKELKHPISVDTYKAEVARKALEAGAHIINDIWGLKKDEKMAEVAAEYRCPVILMQNRQEAVYNHLIPDIISDLEESIEIALRAGIAKEFIILDPGIGFGKTFEHNLAVMKNLSEITGLGYPVLLGTSRKSMIRKVLNLPADDVIEGTAATVALGIAQGCDIVRVHDVKQMKRVADMCDAIVRLNAVEE